MQILRMHCVHQMSHSHAKVGTIVKSSDLALQITVRVNLDMLYIRGPPVQVCGHRTKVLCSMDLQQQRRGSSIIMSSQLALDSGAELLWCACQ